jgi:CheY-like chemotaxis protein
MVEILQAISSLAWPVLAGVALVVLLPTMKKIIASRGFTIKFGGTELSVQDASDQLSTQVQDLQNQVVELKQRQAALITAVDSTTAALDTAPSVRDEAVRSSILQAKEELRTAKAYKSPPERDTSKTVLWVDDNPTNNAYEIAKLERADRYRVDQAKSTRGALGKLKLTNYAVIITDMGRQEDGNFVPDAGLQLISAVRDMGIETPIYVYTSPGSAEQLRDDVKNAGGDGVTGSPVELFSLIESGSQVHA